MSVPAAIPPASGLPPVDQALLPTAVRNGTPAAKQAYGTALGFESLLIEQLAQQLSASVSDASATSDGSSDTGADSASTDTTASQFTQLMPGALASGVLAGGGVGIATELTAAIDPKGSSA